MAEVWSDLPELAPPLIAGVLRQGHKMLLAGSSKAGKSFALIELCIAIAEGRPWFGWACTRGKVLYVNLELDRPSCLHRFKDVYEALGWSPNNLQNIDIWNLRGKAVPMDKLAPKLIRRAAKKNYIAIVIDPIYKVITGDENSADQMAKFCNQFDLICTELGTAVIYCHHHSKGQQGAKRSMDRASGSGVFARDPDALLDLIELEELPESLIENETNRAVCDTCIDMLNRLHGNWDEDVSQDARCSQSQMMAYCRKKLSKEQYGRLEALVRDAEAKVKLRTAWRIEGTLREFPKFEPVNLWFDYPVHHIDRTGVLGDVKVDIEPYKKASNARRQQARKDKEKKANEFEIAFSDISDFEGREVSVQELAEKLEVDPKTVRLWFGDGDRKKEDLKKDFEKYTSKSGKICIRRKENSRVTDGAE